MLRPAQRCPEHVWVRGLFTYCARCNLVSWWIVPPETMKIYDTEDEARKAAGLTGDSEQ